MMGFAISSEISGEELVIEVNIFGKRFLDKALKSLSVFEICFLILEKIFLKGKMSKKN